MDSSELKTITERSRYKALKNNCYWMGLEQGRVEKKETIDITALERQHKEKKISDVEVIVAILKKCRSMTEDLTQQNIFSQNAVSSTHQAIKSLESFKDELSLEIVKND